MEYPSLQRKDLMSLSTIKKEEVLGRQQYMIQTRDIMNIQDIQGSRPEIKGFKYSNKESFINTNQDIKGSQARSLYETNLKQNNSLYTNDIHGAKPQCVKFQTQRVIDPQNPVYKLAYSEYRPYSPSKFIKENKFANQEKQLTTLQRKSLFKSQQKEDIEGSHPTKLYQANSFIGSLKVKDINYPENFVSKRNTNPLNPDYQIYGEYGQIFQIQEIQLAILKDVKVDKDILQLSINPNFNQLQRILKNVIQIAVMRDLLKQQFKEINNIKDIPGAQVGTLKKGIITKRETNPILPNYKLLGDTQLCKSQQYKEIGYRKDHVQNLMKQISKNYKKTEIF